MDFAACQRCFSYVCEFQQIKRDMKEKKERLWKCCTWTLRSNNMPPRHNSSQSPFHKSLITAETTEASQLVGYLLKYLNGASAAEMKVDVAGIEFSKGTTGCSFLGNHLVPWVLSTIRVTMLLRQLQSHRMLDISWPSEKSSIYGVGLNSRLAGLGILLRNAHTKISGEPSIMFSCSRAFDNQDSFASLRWSIHWNCMCPWCRLHPYLIK